MMSILNIDLSVDADAPCVVIIVISNPSSTPSAERAFPSSQSAASLVFLLGLLSLVRVAHIKIDGDIYWRSYQ